MVHSMNFYPFHTTKESPYGKLLKDYIQSSLLLLRRFLQMSLFYIPVIERVDAEKIIEKTRPIIALAWPPCSNFHLQSLSESLRQTFLNLPAAFSNDQPAGQYDDRKGDQSPFHEDHRQSF